jgi:hypothetical protein
MCKFRDLKADEIDCRVATCSDKGVSLLLYKDARVDMNVLDETFGVTGWQRTHELIGDRLYCTVSIYDESKEQWISKQDVGTESYTEKEKGQASDSFKRACFNIGIGRELYTAPFIWVNASDCNMKQKDGRWTTYDRFEVDSITIENKRITGLSIRNTKTGELVFTYGKAPKKTSVKANKPIVQETEVKCPKCGKVMKPIQKADGSVAMPADILKGCGGMCYDCYKAQKK